MSRTKIIIKIQKKTIHTDGNYYKLIASATQSHPGFLFIITILFSIFMLDLCFVFAFYNCKGVQELSIGLHHNRIV